MMRVCLSVCQRSVGTRFLTSCRQLFAAAPDAKYVAIFKSDFETQAFPIDLLGGSHIAFAKVLYKFAEQVDNGNFDLYLKDFEAMTTVVAKAGPFWTEADILNDPAFDILSPGFRFTLAWMQAEKLIDALNQVRDAYTELADTTTNQVRATISVPWDPSSQQGEVSRIEGEARELYVSKGGKSSKILFQYKVNPELKEGYTFEIDNLYVNKSGGALTASSAAAAKDHQKDWTAMPALPVKPIAKGSDLLLKLIGAELDQLADVDEVERKIGA
jgi:hypothetical protein